MLNIALIGAGCIGRIHAANLANEPRLRLSHVFDAMPDAAADVAAATGATVATLETVLADPDIAGVVIASATDKHLDYSVRSEEHTSEHQSLMRISYAGFCLTKTHNTT